MKKKGNTNHPPFCVIEWVKKSTFQFEVAVRARLKLETLTLILKPQSPVVLGPTFNILFMVRVRFSLIKIACRTSVNFLKIYRYFT